MKHNRLGKWIIGVLLFVLTGTVACQEQGSHELLVTIGTIDGQNVNDNQKRIEVGREVSVKGTISDASCRVCVLVHPMSGNIWWVQNLPGPYNKADNNLWQWQSQILCGTKTLGLGENYEIVAIADKKNQVCRAGKQIRSENFPNSLPRSTVIVVRRKEK